VGFVPQAILLPVVLVVLEECSGLRGDWQPHSRGIEVERSVLGRKRSGRTKAERSQPRGNRTKRSLKSGDRVDSLRIDALGHSSLSGRYENGQAVAACLAVRTIRRETSNFSGSILERFC